LVWEVVARNKCSDARMHCRSMEEGRDTVSNGVRGRVGFVIVTFSALRLVKVDSNSNRQVCFMDLCHAIP